MTYQANIGTPEAEFETEATIWSIGIYSGETLFDLRGANGTENPVISAADISDVRAEFVADPFMIKADETWHMFFEVLLEGVEKGEIGWATSNDGLRWNYRQIVLKESFHLSYPYVFYLDGSYYIVPETGEASSIRLYKADPFPNRWTFIGEILEGVWMDPSIFFFDGWCWMFASPAYGRLDLFYAESIDGPWRGHSMNPIVEGDIRIARPGGRVLVLGDKVIRFTQDGYPEYGTQVRAFEISELTTTAYSERELPGPILSPGNQTWNRLGMHHVDPHWVDGRWLACVDGWRNELLNLC